MIVYCMMMASSVQSFMPIPLLHFILNPLIRRLVALRMAKDNYLGLHPSHHFTVGSSFSISLPTSLPYAVNTHLRLIPFVKQNYD